MTKVNTSLLSWNDRFALIDMYQPSDEAITEAFGVSEDELATARELRARGTFASTANFDGTKYESIFKQTVSRKNPVTVHTRPSVEVDDRPETATKKVRAPQKRGRKGEKIAVALRAVPTSPVAIDTFVQQHGISVAVLRQSKRFLSKMPDAAEIGNIKVRKDKGSKTLMIWREK